MKKKYRASHLSKTVFISICFKSCTLQHSSFQVKSDKLCYDFLSKPASSLPSTAAITTATLASLVVNAETLIFAVPEKSPIVRAVRLDEKCNWNLSQVRFPRKKD